MLVLIYLLLLPVCAFPPWRLRSKSYPQNRYICIFGTALDITDSTIFVEIGNNTNFLHIRPRYILTRSNCTYTSITKSNWKTAYNNSPFVNPLRRSSTSFPNSTSPLDEPGARGEECMPRLPVQTLHLPFPVHFH